MKYAKLNLGQIEALVNKVGGDDNVERILSDRMSIVLLKPWQTVEKLGIKPWQTVTLGTFQSEDALRNALNNAGSDGGFEDGSGASGRAVKEIEFSCPRVVDLAVVEVGDLVGTSRDGSTMKDIYGAAVKSGLDYCPDETAAQVLLQCNIDLTDKRVGHELQFAMDPSRRGGHGFRIRENRGKNYLTRFSNSLYYHRGSNEKFVFVIRK